VSAGADNVPVTTQHNDNARTGAILTETDLTPGKIKGGRFGKLFSRAVDGQIYAQPLYLPQVDTPQGKLDIVLVATMHNTLYAFDANDPAKSDPVWKKSLGDSVPFDFMKMKSGFFGHNIACEIGVTGTPVVDPATLTVYLVAKTCRRKADGSCDVVQLLHARDVRTGDPTVPAVEIAAELPAPADGEEASPPKFSASYQLQRPGLLLSNGYLYLAFGSHQDTDPYWGWVLRYRVSNLNEPPAIFCATPTTDEGGIWQAGNGPAADTDGNVYIMTGNGGFDGVQNFGSSFLKLSQDLEVLGYFTPQNYQCLNYLDVDLGSAGPMLIPDTSLVVGGGKEGVFYLLDKTALVTPRSTAEELRSAATLRAETKCLPPGGGANSMAAQSAGHTPENPEIIHDFMEGRKLIEWSPCQKLVAPEHGHALQMFQGAPTWNPLAIVPVFGYSHIHGSPVFWKSKAGSFLYNWAEHDRLRQWQFVNGQFIDTAPPGKTPISTRTGPVRAPKMGMPGGVLSLSANGDDAASGIVWASLPKKGDAFVHTAEGVLRAYDAISLKEIWTSEQTPARDSVGSFAKYCAPTVANGHVYLATFSGWLHVYGALKNPPKAARVRHRR
jgi:outer membrane protein assembly factor BamB